MDGDNLARLEVDLVRCFKDDLEPSGAFTVKFGGVSLEGAVRVKGDAEKFNGFRIRNNFIVDFKRMSDGVSDAEVY